MKAGLIEKVTGLNRRELTARLLTYSGSFLLTKMVYAGLGHILILHRVIPKSKGSRVANTEIEVTPEYLEGVIKYFKKRNYHFISLDELYDVLNGKKLDNRFVIFTFDDGYVDNLTYAYPIFKRYNVPFTIYVTTNFPDRKAILWWYLLEELILEKERLEIEIDGEHHHFDLATGPQKEAAFYKIRSLVIKAGESDDFGQIKEIFYYYGMNIYQKTDQLALSWQQIIELSTDPLVTIGAHTVNHLALNKLPEMAVKNEVMESKKKLEANIDSEVAHFTYPFGSGREVGSRECRIIKGLGFKTATTSRLANIFPAHRAHMECLPRITTLYEERPRYLNLWVTGALPCLLYKGKRVVTTEEILTA